MKNFIRSSVVALMGTMMMVAPAAMADDRSHVASQKVELGDLDLASEAGQRSANLRVSRAVANVCPDRFERDLRRQLEARECQKVARVSAADGMAAYREARSLTK